MQIMHELSGETLVKLICLQAFKEVMATGTVTEAARSLKSTQPRISRLIAELEAEVGFPLFKREKQRLVPTAEGELFFNDTQMFLLAINKIEQVAEDICNNRETGLRILTQSHIAHGLLSRVFGEFDKVVQDIRYNLVVRPFRDLTQWLGGHQFDLAFTLLPPKHPMVKRKKLITIKLMAALPTQSPLVKKDHITIEDLSTAPIITLPKGLPMRKRLDELFDKSRLDPAIRIETPTVFSACQLVTQGLGATLTGPFTASLFTRDDFVLRPIEPEHLVDYAILHLQQDQPRLLVRRFMDFSIKIAQNLNAEVMERL